MKLDVAEAFDSNTKNLRSVNEAFFSVFGGIENDVWQ